MAYIRNAELTLEYLQAYLKKVLPEYIGITSTHPGYAFLIKCTKEDDTRYGEIVGFHDFAHARNFIRKDSKFNKQA